MVKYVVDGWCFLKIKTFVMVFMGMYIRVMGCIFSGHPASALFSMTALVPGGPLRVIPCTMSATEGESHVQNTKGFTSRKCGKESIHFQTEKKPQF